MAKDDDLIPEFENLELPAGDLDAALSEGMPDPTAQAEPPADEPKGGKKKRGKREKKPKPPKEPKAAKTPKAAKAPKPPKEPSDRRSPFGRITEASPFTILLAISLGAIVLAVVLMMLQMAEYGFDYKAKGARQTTAAPASVRFVAPTPTNLA